MLIRGKRIFPNIEFASGYQSAVYQFGYLNPNYNVEQTKNWSRGYAMGLAFNKLWKKQNGIEKQEKQ